MEKQLKCVLLFSLKEMALRKVAVILWRDSDILDSISKFQFDTFTPDESETEWRETVEDKIKDEVLKLKLPKSLAKQVIDIVRPISLDIRRWKKFHQDFFYDSHNEMSLPGSAKLCWTTGGAIDYRKTAEELMRSDKLSAVQRYVIACLYCLEDFIPLLWEELPEEMKEHFYHQKFTTKHLYFFWPHILKGELSKLDYLVRTSHRNLSTFNQYAFEHSVKTSNKTAAEYFFQKLTNEEREASLMRSAHAVLADPDTVYCVAPRLSDILCYLLSLITPEQQMELIKAHPVQILLCFLFWPWQDLFSENASLIWTFLPPSGYDDLLQKITFIFRSEDYYFPKSFREFFMQSPPNFQKYFVDEISETGETHVCRFLSIFLKSEDSECIEIIFRNVDAADRVRLVFHPNVLSLFYKSILMQRWHMVEVCLREASLSKEDRKRWKEAFVNYLECIDVAQIKWGNRKLKRFFKFIDETDASADKRKKGQKRKLENCCAEK